jgi:hypothetical protein
MAEAAFKRSLARSDNICKSLQELDLKKRKKILKNLGPKDLAAISDCFVGLVKQNKKFRIPESDSESLKTVFKPHKRLIKSFVLSKKKNRYKIIQRGGFFTAILAAVIPLISELIVHLVNKYT